MLIAIPIVAVFVLAGVIYGLARDKATPEAAVASVEAKATEAEADAKAMVDHAEATAIADAKAAAADAEAKV